MNDINKLSPIELITFIAKCLEVLEPNFALFGRGNELDLIKVKQVIDNIKNFDLPDFE